MSSSNNNNYNNNKTLDVKSITLSSITVVSIVGFFMWITYIGTTERASINSRLHIIEVNQMEVRDSIKTLLNKNNINNYLTERDLIMFCLKSQLVNKAWQCPSLGTSSSEQINKMNDTDVINEINRLNTDTNKNSIDKK